MDKMRLRFDELQVQSFATGGDASGRGTVRAHDAPTDKEECPTACQAWDTCWDTCGNSCGCASANCTGDCASADCSDTCYWGCYTVIGMISIC